jgi:carbon monoxide dehydrogenase subunit G
VRIEEQFEVEAPIERLYDDLNDVGSMGYCIAGVKEVEVLDADHSRWKIEQRFGAIARTFNLQATVRDRQPPHLIEFDASDHDVQLTGTVRLERLAAMQTRCEIAIDVNAVGPLVPLLEIFAKGPQRQLIRQTIANIRARLEGQPEPSLERVRPRLRVRLRAWLQRLFRRTSTQDDDLPSDRERTAGPV